LVGLALFDPDVNANVKKDIAHAILEKEAPENPPKQAPFL
jgi:hypothetical protein